MLSVGVLPWWRISAAVPVCRFGSACGSMHRCVCGCEYGWGAHACMHWWLNGSVLHVSLAKEAPTTTGCADHRPCNRNQDPRVSWQSGLVNTHTHTHAHTHSFTQKLAVPLCGTRTRCQVHFSLAECVKWCPIPPTPTHRHRDADALPGKNFTPAPHSL